MVRKSPLIIICGTVAISINPPISLSCGGWRVYTQKNEYIQKKQQELLAPAVL